MQVETYNLPHVTAALHTVLDHRTNGFYWINGWLSSFTYICFTRNCSIRNSARSDRLCKRYDI